MRKFVVVALIIASASWGLEKGFPVIRGLDTARGTKVLIDPQQQRVATAVVFLSANCPCSKSHEGVLSELAKTYTEVKFVGVSSNQDESIDFIRDHFETAKLPFPVVRDERAKLADELGAFKTPHVFLVDSKGEILFQGGVDDSRMASRATEHYFEKALAAVRKGEKPNPAKVRSLGCVIRRSS